MVAGCEVSVTWRGGQTPACVRITIAAAAPRTVKVSQTFREPLVLSLFL